MMKDEGRPRDVYCNGWRPSLHHLRHEVLQTRFLLPYLDHADIVRGYDCNKDLDPDAEMTLEDRLFYVELDTGSVNHTRQKKRWKKYRRVQDFLLVVTSTQKRKQNLIRYASDVNHIALFTTLSQAIESPYGAIWSDCHGTDPVALPWPPSGDALRYVQSSRWQASRNSQASIPWCLVGRDDRIVRWRDHPSRYGAV